MLKLDELNFVGEIKDLEENYNDNLKELRKISSFLKNFIKMQQEMGKIFERNNDIQNVKINEENTPLNKINSLLFSDINHIYDSYRMLINNFLNLCVALEKDLIKPLDDFIQNQFNFYNLNLNKIKNINYNFQTYRFLLDNSKNNYYRSSYISNQINSNDIDNSIIRGENDLNEKRDNLIKNKMIAKNDEFIYKCGLAKYNKDILYLNKDYDLLCDNILNLEKAKVRFIQNLFGKFKKYLLEYVQNINIFINKIENINTKEIGEKEGIYISNMIQKYKNDKYVKDKNILRIPLKKFISYPKFCDINNENKNQYAFIKKDIINPSLKINEKECDNLIKDLINNLLNENDYGQENVYKIFEYLNLSVYEIGKKILNYLYEKRELSSIIFLNLQNLEYLSNILGYITLHQCSIFNGKFDLNFKIIYIAERIYYLKKSTNDKVYLCALLSKNKYYRTKQFWRNIIELKLVNKLIDHLKRLNILKKKDVFNKIRNAFTDNSKKYLLTKSRILPLLKVYSLLEPEQIELIDKIAIQEIQSIIKESIPSFANFNFPSEESLDLIAELTQEYKINKENIHYYVTYFNISSYTVRKLIPNEKGNSINIYNHFKTLNEINKKLKLFKYIVPFLSYTDYNNLLLCSKLFHKKLSKKIYKYILKQKNLSKKIRLSIWYNLLGISTLKKKYNYSEILVNTNDKKIKNEIELDVIRTTVGEVDNPKETRNQIANVLYAVSQLNGNIKYCQGMNFIVQFLNEIFGEEEAFYIFLAFFKNTDYYLLFTKDLEELKILFYVFKRVISLLEPELSSYFISNGVDFNYFVSPWFITLFTGSHQYFKGEKDNSQILIRILDNFIVSGFKSIMSVGCVALHSYENIIINKRYEDMMKFLINDMLKSDFFSNKNNDFIENFFTHKINKKLVKNIEEELHQEQKLMNKK